MQLGLGDCKWRLTTRRGVARRKRGSIFPGLKQIRVDSLPEGDWRLAHYLFRRKLHQTTLPGRPDLRLLQDFVLCARRVARDLLMYEKLAELLASRNVILQCLGKPGVRSPLLCGAFQLLSNQCETRS